MATTEKLQPIETLARQIPDTIETDFAGKRDLTEGFAGKGTKSVPGGNLDSVKIEVDYDFLATDALLERLPDSKDYLS